MPSQEDNRFSRRDLFRRSAAVGAAVAVGAPLIVAPDRVRAGDVPSSKRRRALRLAHLTDIHVQPERGAEQGMIACLRHAQSLDDPPQLVLTGGDSVMDAFASDGARSKVQADIWRRVLRGECSLPVRSCLGNHDIWGWNKKRSNTKGDELLWGKKWGQDLLGLDNRYYSFDRAGWHFVVLDSIQPRDDSYEARLDDEQFAWLSDDLQKAPATTPVMVISHIPLLAVAPLAIMTPEQDGTRRVPGAFMHVDFRRIKELFKKHPNVKLCIAGHLHLVDRVDYSGVTYLCNGAVSGRWWQGDNHECDEGYAVLDLYDDGSFASEYVAYGWKPRV